MLITRKSIPRRAFLRGTGAALALPVLDAMTPALAVETKRPIRMTFIEVPNGIMMDKWTPGTEGANFALTRVLEPLADFRDHTLVLSGLDQRQSAALAFEIAGDHPRACTAWLTGAHAKRTAGSSIPSRRKLSGCAACWAERTAARSTNIWRRCAISSVACNWRRNRTTTSCRRSQGQSVSRKSSRNTTS